MIMIVPFGSNPFEGTVQAVDFLPSQRRNIHAFVEWKIQKMIHHVFQSQSATNFIFQKVASSATFRSGDFVRVVSHRFSSELFCFDFHRYLIVWQLGARQIGTHRKKIKDSNHGEKDIEGYFRSNRSTQERKKPTSLDASPMATRKISTEPRSFLVGTGF